MIILRIDRMLADRKMSSKEISKILNVTEANFSILKKGKSKSIKLDTNGTNPTLIKELIDENLIDYIAMDIKNSKTKYNETSGKEVDINDIEETINILLNGKIDYEFRTTVVYEFHDDKDFINIAKLIKGAKLYVLQQFQDSGNLLKDGLHSHKREKLYEFKKILEKELTNVEIRGI